MSSEVTDARGCILILIMGCIGLATLLNLDVWFEPTFWYFLAALTMMLALQMKLIGSRLSKPARVMLALLLGLPLLVYLDRLAALSLHR